MNGALVWLASRPDPKLASPARIQMRKFEKLDLHDPYDVAQALTRDIDVLFNNAGIGGAFGPLVEVDVEHWDRTFAILTRSVFLGIKHGARTMIARFCSSTASRILPARTRNSRSPTVLLSRMLSVRSSFATRSST